MLLCLYHCYDYDFVSFSVAQGFGFWSVRATGNNVARSLPFVFCLALLLLLFASFIFFHCVVLFLDQLMATSVRRVAIYLLLLRCFIFLFVFEPGSIDILAEMMFCFYIQVFISFFFIYHSLSFLSCFYCMESRGTRIYITQ